MSKDKQTNKQIKKWWPIFKRAYTYPKVKGFLTSFFKGFLQNLNPCLSSLSGKWKITQNNFFRWKGVLVRDSATTFHHKMAL